VLGDGRGAMIVDHGYQPLDPFALAVLQNMTGPTERQGAAPAEYATSTFLASHWPETGLRPLNSAPCAELDVDNARAPRVWLAGHPTGDAVSPEAGSEQQIGVLWFGGSWTEQEFLHFRPNFPGFQTMGAYMPGDLTLEHPGEPLRLVRGISTSAELFDVLGARPFLGRTFQPGDDLVNAAPVTVLSYGLWQELGGDPSIVGRQLQLGGRPRTIVGVMPRGFWFPSPAIRMWNAAPFRPDNQNGNWTLVGRVAAGANVDHMEAPLAALAAELGRTYKYPPSWDKTKAPLVTPLREFLVGDVRAGLLATFAAMALILLIACVNVSALMLGQVPRPPGAVDTDAAGRAFRWRRGAVLHVVSH